MTNILKSKRNMLMWSRAIIVVYASVKLILMLGLQPVSPFFVKQAELLVDMIAILATVMLYRLRPENMVVVRHTAHGSMQLELEHSTNRLSEMFIARAGVSEPLIPMAPTTQLSVNETSHPLFR